MKNVRGLKGVAGLFVVLGCVPACVVRYSSSTSSGSTVGSRPAKAPATASGGQAAPVVVTPAPAREQHRAAPSTAPVVAGPAPAPTRSAPVVDPPAVQRAPVAVPIAAPQPAASPAAAAGSRPRTVSDPSAVVAPIKPREVPDLPKTGTPTRARAGVVAPAALDVAGTATKKPAAVQAPSETEVKRSRKVSGQ